MSRWDPGPCVPTAARPPRSLEGLQREALASLSRVAQLACQLDCVLPCGCSTA